MTTNTDTHDTDESRKKCPRCEENMNITYSREYDAYTCVECGLVFRPGDAGFLGLGPHPDVLANGGDE